MHNSLRLQDMLARAREFSKEEQFQAYQAENLKKGMVAGLKTTPEGFADYLRRREAEDAKAKGRR